MHDPMGGIGRETGDWPRRMAWLATRVASAYQRTPVYRTLRHRREVYGAPDVLASSILRRLYDRSRYGSLGDYIWFSRRMPGWTRGGEAVALARVSLSLPDDAVLVEIGSFLGRSTVLLAGARQARGSGSVHCVDAFDGSGDAFSEPIYASIREADHLTLRARFDRYMQQAGLNGRVHVHAGQACALADEWTEPIDFLFLDADQTYRGVRQIYTRWSAFLKPGGIIAVHNSILGPVQDASHNGSALLVKETIHPPEYTNICRASSTTFDQKV